MKNSTFLFLVLILFSCKKNETSQISITEEFKKIETSYTEGCQKNEGISAAAEITTLAPQSYLNTIQPNAILNLGAKTNNLKSSSVPRVGVFKNGSCGSYDELDIFMDCEDGGTSNAMGFIGSSLVDSKKNVNLKFCLVPKSMFGPIAGMQYAVLSCNWIAWDNSLMRYFDNEDSNNANWISLNGTRINGTQLATLVGDGLTQDKNTTLSFQIYDNFSAYPQISTFPDLGISYGVLGTLNQYTKGLIFSNDEFSNNADKMWWCQYDLHSFPQHYYHVTTMMAPDGNNGASTDIFLSFVK